MDSCLEHRRRTNNFEYESGIIHRHEIFTYMKGIFFLFIIKKFNRMKKGVMSLISNYSSADRGRSGTDLLIKDIKCISLLFD